MSDTGYDRQEPDPKVIIFFAVFLLAFVSLAGFGVRGYFLNVIDGEQHVKIAEAPTTEVDKMRAAAGAEMHSYGWVDEKAGTMHMPIERAMELQVEQAHSQAADAHSQAAEKPAADAPKKAPAKKDTKKK